jgi:predicted O-methyltransferase YrrM
MIKRLAKAAVTVLSRAIIIPLVLVTSPVFYFAAKNRIGIGICRRLGFHPLPIHFYEPVPAYESVPDDYFETKQSFPGFSIDLDAAASALKQISCYVQECNWPDKRTAEGVYYTGNVNFGYCSAAILHCMIRSSRTKRLLEVGSGYSSLVALEALKLNYPGGEFRLKCIEPYPVRWLEEMARKHPGSVELLAVKADEADLATYSELGENDVLFIDGSHVSKLGSDVNFIYLQVLPRLTSGVLVHIHDIFIPYEYPREFYWGRDKRFWNEQYLLEAFLTNNPAFEVVLPAYWLMRDRPSDFQEALPAWNPRAHGHSSSFWLRKVS